MNVICVLATEHKKSETIYLEAVRGASRAEFPLPMTRNFRPGSSELSTRLKSEYRRNSMSLTENVMAELAAGTGGTYFHNSNDLNGGFERLAAAPEYLYMLEFSIADRKQDGRYHPLKVKVNQDGLSVQSRRGYFAPKPSRKK